MTIAYQIRALLIEFCCCLLFTPHGFPRFSPGIALSGQIKILSLDLSLVLLQAGPFQSLFPLALAMRCAVTCNFFLQCVALAMLVPFCASTAEITVLFPFPTLGDATHCALHLHGRTWAGAEDKLKEQRLS